MDKGCSGWLKIVYMAALFREPNESLVHIFAMDVQAQILSNAIPPPPPPPLFYSI